MNKLFLAFGLLISSIASASAACTPPAVMHDFPGTAFNMDMVTTSTGNCGSKIDADTSSQLHTDLTAPIAAGTNIIGKVGIDQTTPGTTNAVAVAAQTGWAGGTLGAMANYGTSPGAVLVPGVNASLFYGTTAAVGDPCHTQTKTFLPVTAATSLVKVIATGVAAKKIYICQLLLSNNAADNVAVFEATTGTTCATAPVAVYGAGTSVATAGTGFNFPANGGVSLGNGESMVGQSTVNNNDLCIGTSAATQLTGGITYVTQ